MTAAVGLRFMRKTLFFSLYILFFGIFLATKTPADASITGNWTVGSITCTPGATNCDVAHATSTNNSNYVSFGSALNGFLFTITPSGIPNGAVITTSTINSNIMTSNNISSYSNDGIFNFTHSGTQITPITQDFSPNWTTSWNPYSLTNNPSAYTYASGDTIRFEGGICNGTGCSSIDVNGITGGSFTYNPVASLSLSDIVASQGAQMISFNATGNTGYTQTGEKCTINLYEYNISNPAQPQVNGGSVATVLLDANAPRTSTGYPGNNTYLGYGFTSSVSSWEADGISLPYFNTQNTDIRAVTSCYHQNTNSDGSLSAPIFDVNAQGLDLANVNYQPSLIATPSALQSQPANTALQCGSDVICQFEQWLYTFTCNMFCPNQAVDAQDFSNINSAIQTKAPFAYGYAAMNISVSPTPDASNSAISLNFNFSSISAVPTQYAFMGTSSITPVTYVFNPLRPWFQLILWICLLLFFIGIFRSIFP